MTTQQMIKGHGSFKQISDIWGNPNFSWISNSDLRKITYKYFVYWLVRWESRKLKPVSVGWGERVDTLSMPMTSLCEIK